MSPPNGLKQCERAFPTQKRVRKLFHFCCSTIAPNNNPETLELSNIFPSYKPRPISLSKNPNFRRFCRFRESTWQKFRISDDPQVQASWAGKPRAPDQREHDRPNGIIGAVEEESSDIRIFCHPNPRNQQNRRKFGFFDKPPRPTMSQHPGHPPKRQKTSLPFYRPPPAMRAKRASSSAPSPPTMRAQRASYPNPEHVAPRGGAYARERFPQPDAVASYTNHAGED